MEDTYDDWTETALKQEAVTRGFPPYAVNIADREEVIEALRADDRGEVAYEDEDDATPPMMLNPPTEVLDRYDDGSHEAVWQIEVDRDTDLTGVQGYVIEQDAIGWKVTGLAMLSGEKWKEDDRTLAKGRYLRTDPPPYLPPGFMDQYLGQHPTS